MITTCNRNFRRMDSLAAVECELSSGAGVVNYHASPSTSTSKWPKRTRKSQKSKDLTVLLYIRKK